MQIRLSITQRYVIFITLIITLLMIGAIYITSNRVHNGLTDLFRSRLEHTDIVTDTYIKSYYSSKQDELQTVLSSPRLFAAIETGDKNTVNEEIPYYLGLASADFMIVIDRNDQVLFETNNYGQFTEDLIHLFHNSRNPDKQIEYLTTENNLYEVFYTSMVTPDDYFIGTVISGINYSKNLITNLKDLTGFNIIIRYDNTIVDYSNSPLTYKMNNEALLLFADNSKPGFIHKIEYNDEEFLTLTLPSNMNLTTITYFASLDDHIVPILKESRTMLIILALIGGLLAMGIITYFTNQSIGKQVNHLVEAAEKIAANELDFVIKPTSNDELGYLAGEFERMRAELVKNKSELEQIHKDQLDSQRMVTIGQLATGIIHDFKNPMAVINSSMDMIRYKNKENDGIKKYCDSVNEQIERMVVLTRDILEYAKGETKLDIQTVNLIEYFENLQSFHAGSFEQKGLKFVIDSCEPLFITIDPGRFQRVFDNIINNAREALKPGDRVSLGYQQDEEKLTIYVKDDGPGIPEHIKEKLFDPFVTSGKKNGTGLGLAIAKKVVEDHGAQIVVHSDSEKGTMFEIVLPLKLVTEKNLQTLSV
ncbi:MAG: sensor histidine kinase [Calditrichaeota bacterium]|nr:MAG: sensor histidine kinase [Calditrichota bacterium]